MRRSWKPYDRLKAMLALEANTKIASVRPSDKILHIALMQEVPGLRAE